MVLAVAGWITGLLVNHSLRRVEGASMLPSLWPGDLLLAVPPRWAGGLRRHDVVVADTPSGRVVKRLAGLPGEPVLVGEGHRHVAGHWYPVATGNRPHRFWPEPGQVVLLGDHADASTDSRAWGPVPVSCVVRVALARVRPWAWLRHRAPRPLEGPWRRPTVRVVTFDPDGRVLLFLVRDADGSEATWWEAPGGGIEPGEDPLTTARRELAEEVGHQNVAIVDLEHVAERATSIAGAAMVKVEHLLAARLPDASVRTDGWSADEVRDNVSWRWWTAEELAATDEPIVPRVLPDLLAEARRRLE